MNPITQEDGEEKIRHTTSLEGLLLTPFYVDQTFASHLLFSKPTKCHSEFRLIRLPDTLFSFLTKFNFTVSLHTSIFP
jgi:hypothetical protein